ncbi:MAG: septum formation inhibitor Maf [Nanoarchaeota archaeon]|nr:septum formation inhibitor Maf [Nanoarchaeota archaeon]MBU1854615.1 septum formation inhibitor Maf [Nanoarchaeota archaeon]
MRQIILASTSPRRKGLLQQIGLKFKVVPSNCKEDMTLNLPPEKLVMRLAQEKAGDVVKRVKKGIVIGVDTFIVFKNQKIGKAKNKEEAKTNLQSFSGKTVDFYSGVCIIDIEQNKTIVDFELSKVKIKRMSDKDIDAYLATNEYIGKAGGFAIQGRGAIFIEKVEGCYSNIVGLPLHNLYKNLKKLGVDVLNY